MLIAEFPHAQSSGRPAIVAVMGSCRLYEPFITAVRGYGLKLLVQEYTPFTYSAGEACQYLEFCQGKRRIPEPYWPYVFSDKRVNGPSLAVQAALARADLCVAEVSTLDQLTAGGYYFNWNEVGLSFIRGQGEPYFRWWREVSDRTLRKASAETVERVVRARAAKQQDTSAEMLKFLTEMRFDTLDHTTLQAFLRRLTFGTSRKWIIASHFNIASTGPEIMPDRQALLALLQQVAGGLGHPVFDPTPTIEAFGYRRALQGNGADKHHYTTEFRAALGQALVEAIYAALRPGRALAGQYTPARLVWKDPPPLGGPDKPAAKLPSVPVQAAPPAPAPGQRPVEPADPAPLPAAAEAATPAAAAEPAKLKVAAEAAMAAEDWPTAVARWAEFRKLAPQDVAGFIRASHALWREGRHDAAEALVAEAIALFPLNAWAAHSYADIAVRRADWPEAARRWQGVRERLPADYAGYTNGAHALAQMGQFDAAEALLRWAVEHHPDRPEPWIGMATLAVRRKAWDAAADAWTLVMQRFPDLATGYGGAAQASLHAGRVADAEAIGAAGVAKFPNDLWVAEVYAGLAAYQRRWAVGAQRWSAVRERFPTQPVGYEMGAQCLRDAGNVQDAEALLHEAVRRFPDHPRLPAQLAALYALRQA